MQEKTNKHKVYPFQTKANHRLNHHKKKPIKKATYQAVFREAQIAIEATPGAGRHLVTKLVFLVKQEEQITKEEKIRILTSRLDEAGWKDIKKKEK